ncbi:MAG: DUF748 domain-containing protein [Balneolaceae bacterium]
MDEINKNKNIKKRYWIPLLIIVILIIARLALPYWITGKVNETLENLEGYTGSIAGVDLDLYRGAYSVDSLVVDKIEDNNEVPFLFISGIDLSVEWPALLNGAIVGEVVLQKPEINFVAPNEDDGEFGFEIDWIEPLNELMPIQINRFAIEEGTIRYMDFSSEPQLEIPLHNIELEILNINNAENQEEDLPSNLSMQATSIGSGILDIQADANLMKPIPDIDLNFEFEQVHLPDLNEFLEAYASVDAENGEFNLYSEIIIKDGMLEGYVRPIITDLRILDVEEGSVAEVAWEAIVGFVTEIFENQREDQFATEVPLSGDLNDVEAGIYPTIWNIFRNAFVEAFSQQTGGDVEFNDLNEDGEEENE